MKKKPRSPFRPASRALALEPRLLFDGAGAVAAVDNFDMAGDHHAEVQKQDTQPAAEARPSEVMEKTPGGGTLLIIDSRVADFQSLLADIPGEVSIRVVDLDESGLNVVGAELAKGGQFDAVHIISHGTPGSFSLGRDTVNGETLASHADSLQAWAGHLSADADILLYGCDVAQGDAGQAFISELARLTSADIAASTNATGAAEKGGDWVLESATGAIEAGLLGAAGYEGLLAATSIADANAATPRITAEDTPLAITGISVAGGAGDTITLTINTTGGISTLGSVAGLTSESGNGTSAITITGTIADVNNALATLSYSPTADQNSSTTGFTPSIALAVTSGGSGSLTISNIQVTAVNDAPNLSTQVALTVSEGGSAAFSLAQLASSEGALDVDIATGQQVIGQQMVIINSLPGKGTLTYQGGAVAVGQVIPVTSLGSLQYTHNGTDLTAVDQDSFDVTVSDGGGGQTPGSISIGINPANKAPSISGSPTLIEGQVKVVAPTIDFGDAYDNLGNATIKITTVDNGNQGALFFDANNDGVVDAGEAITAGRVFTSAEAAELMTKLKFKQGGTEPNMPGGSVTSPSYTIEVADAGGGAGAALSATKTITIDVTPNNDDPTLDTNTGADSSSPVAVTEGTIFSLKDQLVTTDPDRNPADTGQTTPKDQLVYTLESVPAHGEVQLDIGGTAGWGTRDGTGTGPYAGADGWITLGEGGRFTQADIDAGRVRFVQTSSVNNGDTVADQFTFTVRDSAFGFDVWTDPSNPTSGREGGVRDTETGAIATQTFHLSITGNENPHTVYEGGPRPAWPGYGNTPEQTLVYEFKPMVAIPGNRSDSTSGEWQEANVVTPLPLAGGNIITTDMLHYQIDRIAKDASNNVVATIVLPASETVYTLTTQPPNGEVQRLVGVTWETIPTNGQFTQYDIDNNKIRFVHDGGEDHVATFDYRVSDGTDNHFDGSFAIDVTPTNDRPTATGSASAQVTEGNDNAVRLDSTHLGMNDVDLSLDASKQTGEGAKDFLWFQVAAQPKDGGSVNRGELQRWNGSAWVAVGASEWLPSTLLTATADGGTSGLRYVHDGSEPLAYIGGPKVSFAYVVRDDLADPGNPFAAPNATAVPDTSGTAQSNQSTAATVTINIIPVNDAPMVADKPGDADPTITETMLGGGATTGVNQILANVPEGGTVQITNAYLQAIDRDNTKVQRQFRITAVPTEGTLLLNGVALGVGSTFTQADIDGDGGSKLEYRHNGDEVGALISGFDAQYHDKFHFVVNDGVLEDNGADANHNVFLITLAPTNDIPTIKFQNASAATDWFVINSTSTGKTLPKINLGDLDLEDAIVQTGEQDFVQVTVEFQTSTDTAYANGVLNFSSTTAGVQVIGTEGGHTLVFQGKLADVQTALDKVQAKVSADDTDNPSNLKIKITVDDQLRDGTTGVLTTGANGGTTNSDPTKATINDANNRVSITVGKVAVSTVNNPPVIAVPGSAATVPEDIRTKIDGISFTDPDAFNSTSNTLTLEVDKGKIYFATSGNTVTGGATLAEGTKVGDSKVVLQGTKTQLDDALASLYYLSPENFNGSSASATDAVLTVAVNDGGNTGSDGAKSHSGTVNIQITPVNDKPTVTVPGTPMAFRPNVTTPITGISVGDIDIDNTHTNDTGVFNETNFVQVTVRVVEKQGGNWSNPRVLEAVEYNSAGTSVINIGFNGTAPIEDATFDIDDTYNGSQKALVIRGEIGKVNAYLAGLTLNMTGDTLSNADKRYGLQVIVDDRVRTSGAITGTDANGGQNPNAISNPTGVANQPTDDMATPYAAIPVAATTHNVASAIRELLPSDVNDPARILGPLTADEGINGYVTLAQLNIIDLDALETNKLKATVTLPAHFTIADKGSNSGTNFTFSGEVGDTEFSIEGTLEQINARLESLKIALPTVGDAAAADWNGAFNVRVVVEDLGNNGSRPSSLPTLDGTDTIGTNDTTGVFSYANGSGEANDNYLITTRTITFTVSPTNDAPVAKPVNGNHAASLAAIDEDPGYAADDVAGSHKTVDQLFSPYFDDSKDEIKNNQVSSADTATGTNADSFWGVAVVGNAATAAQGQWEYHNGTTWVAIATDVANSKALILDKDTPLRFNPAADYHGTPGQLSVRLIEDNDNGDTSSTASVPASDTANHNIGVPGDTSRYSSDVVTLGITVNNVNDRPTVSTGSLSTTEDIGIDPVDNPGVTVDSLKTTLGYSDAKDDQSAKGSADSSTPMGGIAIVGDTTAAGSGHWEYSTNGGTTWTTVPASVSDSSALVLGTADKLRFVPDANYNGTPAGGLTVRVADSDQSGNKGTGKNLGLDGSEANNTSATWSATTTLGVAVVPQNDAPAFSHAPTDPTATEPAGTSSSTTWVALLGTGTVSDIDLTTTSALASTVFGQGSVTVALTSGITGDNLRLNGLSAGSNGISTITGGANGASLVVSFTNAATLAEVKAVLEAIEYQHVGDDPTNIKSGTARSSLAYSITLNDGDNVQSGGNAGGPNPLTASKSGAISFTPANDPPVAEDDTNTMTRVHPQVVGNLITATSTDGAGANSTGTPDHDPDTVIGDLKTVNIKVTTASGPTTDKPIAATGETEIVGKYGTLKIKADGSYTYELDRDNPTVYALGAADPNLVETFEYTLSDKDATNPGTDTATLTITITGQPVLPPTIAPSDENAAGDADGHITVHESGLNPGGSEAATNKESANGKINITADAGLKSVTIHGTVVPIADLNGATPTSPVTITVTGVGTLKITDVTWTSGASSAPRSGHIDYTFELTADQTHLVPGNDGNIVDLVLKVTDVNNTEVTATTPLKVQIIDDVPTATNDTGSITKGSATVTGNAYSNDKIGADGAAVAGPVTAITGGTVGTDLNGTYGKINLAADGTYTYTLDNTHADIVALQGGQSKTDTFTYTITDEDGDTSTATITITINGPSLNNVPTARPDTYTATSGTPVSDDLTGNDSLGDGAKSSHTWSKTTDPANGTVTVNPDGTFTYTPNPGFGGTDSFTYTVRDADGDTSTATVTINVNGVPVAVNDSATTPPGTPVSGNLSGNDTPSPDGGNVWTKTTDPSNGTVTVNPDGSYVYTPNAGFTGTDTFTYTITDKDGDTSTATVTITVNNGVPVAKPDSVTTDLDKPVTGNLAGNDTPSPDGGNVWSKTTDPANGTVVVNPDGTFTYTPKPGFTGTDSFTYTVTDANGDASTTTVTITVVGKPGPVDPPAPTPTPTPTPTPPPVDPVDPPVPPVPVDPSRPEDLVTPQPPPVPDTTPYSPLARPDPLRPSVLPQDSPVILDAGPYFANERFDDVRRLPLPFHPIVYVNRAVESAQAQRTADDPRGFSDPAAVMPGERPPLSLGLGLGMDINLFVTHAVRDSQRDAGFLKGTVEGRYGRLGLGSDGYLAQPGLFRNTATEIENLLEQQRKKLKKAAGEAPAAVADGEQGEAPAGKVAEKAVEKPAQAAPQRLAGGAAPSFGEQLRSGAARLPLAPRKA